MSTDDAAPKPRTELNDPAYRTLHGYHGPTPIHLGEIITVDTYAGSETAGTAPRTFLQTHRDTPVNVSKVELLNLARDITRRLGYQPDPLTATSVRLERERNGTIRAHVGDVHVGTVWGPTVDGAWAVAVNGIRNGQPHQETSRHDTHALALRVLLDGCGFRFEGGRLGPSAPVEEGPNP